MRKPLQIIFLLIILLIPVIIFLFLKGAGENKFSIPVYYESGIPDEQRFDCTFSTGAYRLNWADSLNITDPVLMFFSEPDDRMNSSEKRNIFRRILQNSKTPLLLMMFYSREQELSMDRVLAVKVDSLRARMNCLVASDTLNQFILADKTGRIRGYYNTSLEEQDRLLVELKILAEEK